jgi:hypothetical protein
MSQDRRDHRQHERAGLLPLPPDGFRSKSEDMLAFHRERGIQSRRGRGRNDEGQFFVTFCFADPRRPTLSALGSVADG